jgi:hypothetical protein
LRPGREERPELAGRKQEIGEPSPMMGRIAKGILQPKGTAQVELRVTIVCEAKAAMKLDGPVTCENKTISCLNFCHSERDLGILAGGDQRCGVVNV